MCFRSFGSLEGGLAAEAARVAAAGHRVAVMSRQSNAVRPLLERDKVRTEKAGAAAASDSASAAIAAAGVVAAVKGPPDNWAGPQELPYTGMLAAALLLRGG